MNRYQISGRHRAALFLVLVLAIALGGWLCRDGAWGLSPQKGPVVTGPDTLIIAHEGDLKLSPLTSRIVLAPLMGNGHDQLIVARQAGTATVSEPGGGKGSYPRVSLEGFEVQKSGWKHFWSGPKLVETRQDWTVGDLDGDGRAEVVVFQAKGLDIYAWTGKTMKRLTLPLKPAPATGAVGSFAPGVQPGLAGLVPKPAPAGSIPPRALHTWTWKGGGILAPKASGPPNYHGWDGGADQVLGVGDITNTGKPRILLMRGQSDVSPSVYELLSLDGKLQGTIHLKKAPGQAKNPPAFVGALQPFTWERKVYLVGNLLNPAPPAGVVQQLGLGMLAGSNFSLRDVINLDKNFSGAWTWGLPLGTQPGLLLVRPNGATYFYQVERGGE